MTKELFIETIKKIELQQKHDLKCLKAFEIILPDTNCGFYNNSFLQEQILKILKTLMSDKDEWIEYYIYELNFGENPHKLNVTINDKVIPLKTPLDLWNILTKQ